MAFYSKYDEWCDAGKPYWQGVTLFIKLHTLPVLQKHLQSGDGEYNQRCLDGELKKAYSKVPGVKMESVVKSPESSESAESGVPGPKSPEAKSIEKVEPPVNMAMAERLVQLPAEKMEEVVAITGAKKKVIPFANLPPSLKEGRMKAEQLREQRNRLHGSLPSVHINKGTIALLDVLKIIGHVDPMTQAPKPCSYVRYTHNRRTGDGGRRVEVANAVWLTENAQANPREYNERQASRAAKALDPNARHKPGEHWRNATRNFLLPDGSKDKMIIWLLTEFNGMRVVLPGGSLIPQQPLDAEMAKHVCKNIVDMSDAIDAHYDAEDLFASTGQEPFVQQDAEAKMRAMTEDQVNRYLTNNVRPRQYRARSAMRTAEGDKFIELKRRLDEADQENRIGRQIAREMKDARVKLEEHAAKEFAKSEAKRAVKNAKEKVVKKAKRKKAKKKTAKKK